LRQAVRELVSWGAPLLASGQGDDEFRTQWLALPVRIIFTGVDVSDLAPLTVLVKPGGEPATLEVRRDGLDMNLGAPPGGAGVEVEGEPEQILRFLTGAADARTLGVTLRGARDDVRRLRAVAARSPVAIRATPAVTP
jgi:hypothetical protein